MNVNITKHYANELHTHKQTLSPSPPPWATTLGQRKHETLRESAHLSKQACLTLRPSFTRKNKEAISYQNHVWSHFVAIIKWCTILPINRVLLLFEQIITSKHLWRQFILLYHTYRLNSDITLNHGLCQSWFRTPMNSLSFQTIKQTIN